MFEIQQSKEKEKKSKRKKMVTEGLSKFKSALNKASQPLHLKITDQEAINKSNSNPIKKKSDEKTSTTTSTSITVDIIKEIYKMHPEKISWNGNREKVYDEKTCYGSKRSNLLADVVTKRKKPISHSFRRSIFLKALADTDVPTEWI